MIRVSTSSGTIQRVRVLMTEGSSLSARQTIYALARAGAIIDVCDPRPLMCLARYSRLVQSCFGCPPFNHRPVAYVEFLKQRLRAGSYDALIAVHDETFVLSKFRNQFLELVGLAVPAFDSMERLQSKAEFVRLLAELSLPHPETSSLQTGSQLEKENLFPYYVKL